MHRSRGKRKRKNERREGKSWPGCFVDEVAGNYAKLADHRYYSIDYLVFLLGYSELPIREI